MHHYPRQECYASKFVPEKIFVTIEEVRAFDTKHAL